MCAQDKGKAFPLKTQKLEPGQERHAGSSALKTDFRLIAYCHRHRKTAKIQRQSALDDLPNLFQLFL